MYNLVQVKHVMLDMVLVILLQICWYDTRLGSDQISFIVLFVGTYTEAISRASFTLITFLIGIFTLTDLGLKEDKPCNTNNLIAFLHFLFKPFLCNKFNMGILKI